MSFEICHLSLLHWSTSLAAISKSGLSSQIANDKCQIINGKSPPPFDTNIGEASCVEAISNQGSVLFSGAKRGLVAPTETTLECAAMNQSLSKVPTFDKLMNPLITALRDMGGSGSIEDIYVRVTKPNEEEES